MSFLNTYCKDQESQSWIHFFLHTASVSPLCKWHEATEEAKHAHLTTLATSYDKRSSEYEAAMETLQKQEEELRGVRSVLGESTGQKNIAINEVKATTESVRVALEQHKAAVSAVEVQRTVALSLQQAEKLLQDAQSQVDIHTKAVTEKTNELQKLGASTELSKTVESSKQKRTEAEASNAAARGKLVDAEKLIKELEDLEQKAVEDTAQAGTKAEAAKHLQESQRTLLDTFVIQKNQAAATGHETQLQSFLDKLTPDEMISMVHLTRRVNVTKQELLALHIPGRHTALAQESPQYISRNLADYLLARLVQSTPSVAILGEGVIFTENDTLAPQEQLRTLHLPDHAEEVKFWVAVT